MKNFKQFKMLSWPEKKSVFIKYTLVQIPETAVFIIILLVIDQWFNIPVRYFWIFVALWILKDLISFPFLWSAFNSNVSPNQYPCIGTKGLTLEKCAPRGFVSVQGERWQAEAAERGMDIDKGERIVVTGRKGLILMIRPGKD